MPQAPLALRIVDEDLVSPDSLLANPLNWRTHGAVQTAAVDEVLRRVGWVQRIIVNRRTGLMVDGHLRVRLASENAQPFVPVSYVDLSPDEEALILRVLDPLTGLAGTDRVKLSDLLDTVAVPEGELQNLLDGLRPTNTGLPWTPPGPDGDVPPLDLPPSDARQVQLFFTADSLVDFLSFVERLGDSLGTSTVTDTVLAVMLSEAARND
jgi:hypothetical protein